MAEPRHLGNSPITEAVIDLRVRLPPEVDASHLRKIAEGARAEYPSLEEQHVKQFVLKAGPGTAATSSSLQGFILRSPDKLNVVQFRMNGFALSRLKPYQTWEDLLEEARQLWQYYRAAAKPEAITRIAVRYINHLRFTSPIPDVEKLLIALPGIPDEWPQFINSFLYQTTLHDPETGFGAVVTQASETAVDPGQAMFILDIDCFSTAEVEPASDKTWEVLAQLRDMKNRIFFSSLTTETLKRYE